MVTTYDAPHTIMLAGKYRLEEDLTTVAVTPGMLVQTFNSSGKKIKPHATAGGVAERAFAVEAPLEGISATSGTSRGIDDDYAIGELVHYHLVEPGAVVRAWLKDGENVVPGDLLISAGDGTLKKTTGSPLCYVAVAEEALDLSASSNTTNARITVRVL